MKAKIFLLLAFFITSNFLFSEENRKNDPEGNTIEKENLSIALKLNYSAVSMITTSDNSLLFFQISDPTKKSKELHFTVYDKKVGTWSTPQILDLDFNNLKHKQTKSVLIKKKEIFITKKGKDLYTIQYSNKKKKWKSPKKLKSNINSKGNETTACISPDGSTLYFSSEREGSYGGKDIFACDRLSNGGWSKSYNLGEGINTPEDEESPFMLRDNSTLYFSSKGHNSMGGYDVFYATRSDDGFWDEIDHLSAPINTKGDDLYFIMNDDEVNAFYSSNGNNEKKLNLYRLKFAE